jgi:anti-sigma regulatory factor (Ser/Thr protein kinase)
MEINCKIHEKNFPATIGSCELARSFVKDVAGPMNFNSLDMFQLELAVDEGFVNAADHGNYCSSDATVFVKILEFSDRLTVMIKDFGGKPFNPTFFERIADHRTWGVGGRGIKIIKEIMDEVMYVFLEGQSTTLYMTKFRSDESEEEK